MCSESKGILLQKEISPEDASWVYTVKNPRNPKSNNKGDKIPIKFISFTERGIELKIEFQSPNRILTVEDRRHDKFIGISFANLRFEDLPPKTAADYIERFLITGIELNKVKYYFYGHSNSQLKSRTCYLYAAFSGEQLFNRINGFGDFSKISAVAKRAKRIGLLFSAAESQIKLDSKFTLDIEDVEREGHIFTDGCGLISKSYANLIAKHTKIIFHNTKYVPCVFQIRYKGYKGTVMIHPNLPSPHHFHFVKSMRKFTNCSDDTFAVLDYAKPFVFGFLNGELVTLLSTLGIRDEVFKEKQKYYFDFLKKALSDPMTAFMYLSYKGENNAAESILLNGIDKDRRNLINRLRREEWKGCYDKRDKEKVRILIPLSRLLFGVADHSGVLQEGEVHIRIKIEGMNERTLDGMEVIVGRNPCLHPGDIRKFKAVYKRELEHLVDCIVFPILGDRDAPSLMSGGDLDGDRFFVSWDQEIIPTTMYEPYGYPPAKEAPRREINYESMVKYFSQYNNASLGKVKNLFLKWVKVSDNMAGSKECQELNALFSSCVDGERIRIPNHLQSPPEPKNGQTFILDLLCEQVKNHANTIFQSEADAESVKVTPLDLMEFLLTSKSVCLDEFELFQLAHRWCINNHFPIENFLHCFNFGAFSLLEKHMIACQFKLGGMKDKFFQSLYNGLHHSRLLTEEQIKYQNLNHARIYWQKLYDSHDDNGKRLEVTLLKALELYDRKLLVIHVDTELIIAMYFAHKIVLKEELNIGKLKNCGKVFGFSSTGHNYCTNIERNYKINFDGNVIQLFDENLPNTFVWFALQNENFPWSKEKEPVQNKIRKEYRNWKNIKEPNQNDTLPSPQFKISIALQKFSGELMKSRSKVIKTGSQGIEIYVISNRDREGQNLLDLSMNQVDTNIVVKLEKNIPKEYNLNVDLKEDVYWANRKFCEKVILLSQLEGLNELDDICQFQQIIFICETLTDEDIGDTIFSYVTEYILVHFESFDNKNEIWVEIFRHLHKLPKVACLIIDKIHESEFSNGDSPSVLYPLEEYQSLFLLYGVIQSANSGKELTFSVFEKLVQIIMHHKFIFSAKELVSLLKSIVYSVRHTDIAEKLLHELFNEETQIFRFDEGDSTENILCFRYLKKFTLALALDYLGEANDNCPCDFGGIPEGAEDLEDESNTNVANKHPNYRLCSEKHTLADFMGQLLHADSNNPLPNMQTNFRGAKPKPAMKCLIIQATDKFGFYKTILRTDIQNKIRSGDHLRFCASRRATDKKKRRVTVFSAVVDSITSGELIFEMKQKPPRELFSASWNVYICNSTTTFNAMLIALRNLISLKEEITTAFRSILGLPPKPPNMGLLFERKEVDIPPQKFNEMQTTAIKAAINSPMTLIWGPPGTGKTTVVVEILLQFVSLRAGLSILVSASTHNAVDNVLSRFLKERSERFGDKKSEDVVRITSDMEKVADPELQKWTLNAFVGGNIHTNDKAKREAIKRLKNARVVFSTCSGAGVGLLKLHEDGENNEDVSKKKKKQKEQSFDVVIVDEASQVTEPNALIPIVKMSRYVILVGDHVQLRPTVSQIAKDCGLETTLFEKLYLSKESSDKFCTKIMLNVQYRMHPILAEFPSRTFYDGKLLSGVNKEHRVIPKSKFPWPICEGSQDTFPLVFINCSSVEYFGTGSTSKMNLGQIQLTLKIIKDLQANINNLDPGPSQLNYSITVLSPYTKQVTEIQSKIKAANCKNVDVKTIDSFQGRESDIIIYSSVRANWHKNLGFLDDSRRMNVSLTRARLGFILIGDENTLRGNELWENCIKNCKRVEYTFTKKDEAKSSGNALRMSSIR